MMLIYMMTLKAVNHCWIQLILYINSLRRLRKIRGCRKYGNSNFGITASRLALELIDIR
jgi:hypothetical protein